MSVGMKRLSRSGREGNSCPRLHFWLGRSESVRYPPHPFSCDNSPRMICPVSGRALFRRWRMSERMAAAVLAALTPVLLSAATDDPKPTTKETADVALFSAAEMKWREGPPSLPKG